MMNTLKELWHGNLHPQEQRREQRPEIQELLQLSEINRNRLYETLSDQQKETFEKYVDCLDELSCLTESELFIQAFRLGGKIMLETLSSN
ncbi:MAG: hypothetical protein IJ407_03895 [Clostridia bacterium]|nr:hypothetical protein [Clostridia bacterium]